MNPAGSVAIFASYFLTIFFLLFYLAKRLRSDYPRTILLGAALSLATTWTYMFLYFRLSFILSGATTIPQWLNRTSLFKQAWTFVSTTAVQRFWSRQIFLATIPWSVSLSKMKGRHAAMIVLLGEMVAISFAMNISFMSRWTREEDWRGGREKAGKDKSDEKKKQEKEAGWSLWGAMAGQSGRWYLGEALIRIIVWGCYYSVFRTHKAVGTKQFMPYLLAPHAALLFLPWLIGVCVGKMRKANPNDLRAEANLYFELYTVCSLLGAIFMVSGWVEAVDEAGSVTAVLAEILNGNPALKSVGWDVIMVGVSVVIRNMSSEYPSLLYLIPTVVAILGAGVGSIGMLIAQPYYTWEDAESGVSIMKDRPQRKKTD